MSFLNSLIDNLDEALIILDKEGKILLINKVATELNKSVFQKPFVEGDYLVNCLDKETSQAVLEIIQRNEQNQPEKYFADLKNHQGPVISLEFNFVPLHNSEGLKTHTYILIHDITEYKLYERKIVNQASNISSLIEKANAIIIGLDTGGYITDWNKHCEVIIGFRKEEVLAQKFGAILLREVDGKEFEEMFAKALRQESDTSHELLIRTSQGNLVTLLLSCTARLSSSNQLIGLILVGQDITELIEYRMALEMKVEERTRELRRALQKKREALEIKSRFVSVASHEFRSPLSSIQYHIDFIKQTIGAIGTEDPARRLNSIEKHVQHMTALLDDVLTYEKSESNKIKLDFSKIELHDFLNKIIEGLNYYESKSNCSIQTDFSHIPLIMISDERLLRSILTNLLTNAIKFSPDRERVFLTVKGSGHQLIIIVRDEGIGIDEDEIEKVFEPFLRGRSAASIQGTGLGLSIVKKSVQLLNGTIHVKSTLGEGTTFTVAIPNEQG
jgi:PAS domain S-box-containing protein